MLFSPQKKSISINYLVLLLVLLVLLGLLGAAGWYSRYLADDYCYDAQFNSQGFFWGQIDSYLHLMPYSSNRYSLTLFYDIAWILGGVKVSPFSSGLAILVWGLSLYYAISQGLKNFRYSLPKLAVAFIAANIIFFTLLLAPNRYQILYWRSGMLTYLLPLVFNTLLIGRYFYYSRRDQVNLAGYVELGAIAWITAGFSETVFAIQIGIWGLILLFSILFRRRTSTIVAVVVLIGSLMGFALLFFNPTNAIRQSHFQAPPPIWKVAFRSIEFAKDFLITTIRATWLPFAALLLTGVLFGWLEAPSNHLTWRSELKIFLGLFTALYFLLICNMAPTIWSMSSYPELRGLLPGTYLLCAFFFVVGVLVGGRAFKVLESFFPQTLKVLASTLLLVALCGYLIHFFWPIYTSLGLYKSRAKAWDARNAEIIADRTSGQSQVTVEGIDSIAGIFELQPNEGHWVNRCAARYYNLTSIRSSE